MKCKDGEGALEALEFSYKYSAHFRSQIDS